MHGSLHGIREGHLFSDDGLCKWHTGRQAYDAYMLLQLNQRKNERAKNEAPEHFKALLMIYYKLMVSEYFVWKMGRKSYHSSTYTEFVCYKGWGQPSIYLIFHDQTLGGVPVRTLSSEGVDTGQCASKDVEPRMRVNWSFW